MDKFNSLKKVHMVVIDNYYLNYLCSSSASTGKNKLTAFTFIRLPDIFNCQSQHLIILKDSIT
ncbi:hypothetical protein BH23BAC1_BH23BAC1_43740 [soil metagenome]